MPPNAEAAESAEPVEPGAVEPAEPAGSVGSARPAVRHRDAAATRAAILAAARALFTEHGYDGTGLRDIARAAGSDSRLISRYFGSKEGLFAEVVDLAYEKSLMMTPEQNAQAARALLVDPDRRAQDGLLLTLRSAANPRAAAIMRESIERNYQRRLAGQLDGPDTFGRSSVLIAICSGVLLNRLILGHNALNSPDTEKLIPYLHAALDAVAESPAGAGAEQSAVTDPHVRAAQDADREAIARLLTDSWGATTVIAHGIAYDALELPALVAEVDGSLAGLLTYALSEEGLEVVSLDAVAKHGGVGSALLAAAVSLARSTGQRRLWLTTTNDNLDALRFYQRRGLRIVGVTPGAVDAARTLKPSIPVTGEYDIALHDELVLELRL